MMYFFRDRFVFELGSFIILVWIVVMSFGGLGGVLVGYVFFKVFYVIRMVLLNMIVIMLMLCLYLVLFICMQQFLYMMFYVCLVWGCSGLQVRCCIICIYVGKGKQFRRYYLYFVIGVVFMSVVFVMSMLSVICRLQLCWVFVCDVLVLWKLVQCLKSFEWMMYDCVIYIVKNCRGLLVGLQKWRYVCLRWV